MAPSSGSLLAKIDTAITKTKDKRIVRDGKIVTCLKCQKQIRYTNATVASRIREHAASVEHNSQKTAGMVQLIGKALTEKTEKQSLDQSIDGEILDAFLSADIPLHKLKHPKLRRLLSHRMSHKVKHPQTYRRKIESLANQKTEAIVRQTEVKDVFFVIDETPDCKSRNVVNLLVGLLDGTPTKPMLLTVSFPDEVNNKTIQEIVYEACNILWNGQNRYPHLHLILSDQAKYMMCAVKKLKEQEIMFPNLNHISCIVHAIDLVCSQIMADATLVNAFLVNQKLFFKNSGKRKRQYVQKTKLSLPPFPVITRWGSWLTAVKYHVQNFDQMKAFSMDCEVKSAGGLTKTLENMKKLLSDDQMTTELMALHHFLPLPGLMKQLESESMAVDEQRKLLQQVKELIPETIRNMMLVKCNQSL